VSARVKTGDKQTIDLVIEDRPSDDE